MKWLSRFVDDVNSGLPDTEAPTKPTKPNPRSGTASRNQDIPESAPYKTYETPERLPPIDSRLLDRTYLGWPHTERKRFLDRVDALEADGLDIGMARDQAFRELTGPTS